MGSRPVVDGTLRCCFSDPALTADLRRLRVNGVALRQDRPGAIDQSKDCAASDPVTNKTSITGALHAAEVSQALAGHFGQRAKRMARSSDIPGK